MMYKSARPPLGVRPRFVVEEERIIELKAAIVRYVNDSWPIPYEIMREYNALVAKLKCSEEADGGKLVMLEDGQ